MRLLAPLLGLALLGAACSDDKPSSAAVSNEMGATGQVASPGVSTAPDEPVEKITVAGDSISVGLGSALREAVEAKASVWIGYVDNHGTSTERIVDPVRVEGGQLTAYDHRSEDLRGFAVHRITAVRSVDPASPAGP